MVVYRIVHGELQEVTREQGAYVLFNGDCYLIDPGALGPLWVWLGEQSSVDERFAASYQANNLRLERGELPAVKSVKEGEEPPELREALGSFIIVEGGVHGLLKLSPGMTGEEKEGGRHLPALYRVEGTTLSALPFSQDSLTPKAVVILDAGLILWVWLGQLAVLPDPFFPIKLIRALDSHHPDPELRWVAQGAEDPRFLAYFRLWGDDSDA